jgi:hypothetical protein
LVCTMFKTGISWMQVTYTPKHVLSSPAINLGSILCR